MRLTIHGDGFKIL